MNFLAIGLLGAGIYFFSRKKREKQTTDQRANGALPPALPHPALPPASQHDAVPFDVYPSGTSKDLVGAPPIHDTHVTFTEDCEMIAVAHGWWENVARPWVAQLGNTPDAALEVVTETIPCSPVGTPAVNEFLADLDAAIDAWYPPKGLSPAGPPPAGFDPYEPPPKPIPPQPVGTLKHG